MEEQRRSKRIPVYMELEVFSLFKRNNDKSRNVHAPIEVQNISRRGIGFKTQSIRQLDIILMPVWKWKERMKTSTVL